MGAMGGPEQYGRFLIEVFEDWVRRDIGAVYVQMFDAALANWHGEPGGMCVHAETCGLHLAIEHTGDLYSCDHYVEPGYLLGNIADKHMLELIASPAQRTFGQDKRDTLTRYCRDCDVRFACNGGCPKDRFAGLRVPSTPVPQGQLVVLPAQLPARSPQCGRRLRRDRPACHRGLRQRTRAGHDRPAAAEDDRARDRADPGPRPCLRRPGHGGRRHPGPVRRDQRPNHRRAGTRPPRRPAPAHRIHAIARTAGVHRSVRHPRLVMPGRKWEDYLTLAVTEIREYGSGAIQVTRRLRAMLEDQPAPNWHAP